MKYTERIGKCQHFFGKKLFFFKKPCFSQISLWCDTHPFLKYLEEIGIILKAAALCERVQIPFAVIEMLDGGKKLTLSAVP